MIVRFSRHAEHRFSWRKISRARVGIIVNTALERYFDTMTHHQIAVENSSLPKVLIVAYQEFINERWIITAHPMRRNRIASRLRKGRWIKL